MEYKKINEIQGNVENFHNDVNLYSDLDKRISSLTTQILPLKKNLSELNKQKIQLKGGICKFMDVNNITTCSLQNEGGGVLQYQKRTRNLPITETFVRDKLLDFFTNPKNSNFSSFTPTEKAEKIYFYIYKEKRDKKTTDVLLTK